MRGNGQPPVIQQLRKVAATDAVGRESVAEADRNNIVIPNIIDKPVLLLRAIGPAACQFVPAASECTLAH